MSELRMRILLILLIMLSAGAHVSAAGLSNPMRPPTGYTANAAVSSRQTKTERVWILQSVLLSAERAVAIIDGVAVARGELYQGARVLKIKADEVVLRSQDGKGIVLKLTPGIHKKTVSADTEINLK